MLMPDMAKIDTIVFELVGSLDPIRSGEVYARTDLTLELRYCALVTFPKKSFTQYVKNIFNCERRFICKGGLKIYC